VRTIRFAAALLATLGLVALATAPALAVQSKVEGRPTQLDGGDASGVYIWHGDDGWHLRATERNGDSGHTYTGVLETDGWFSAVEKLRLETSDGAQRRDDGSVGFRFTVYNGTDGVDWRLHGASWVTFALYRDGDPMDTDDIYLGADGDHPGDNGFTLTR
jgi:hypothetical protein